MFSTNSKDTLVTYPSLVTFTLNFLLELNSPSPL